MSKEDLSDLPMSLFETQKIYEFPATVLFDKREKTPWTFESVKADVKEGGMYVSVKTKPAHLKTADYTLEGLESKIAIERKSLLDLYGTIGQNRDRFERELERLASIKWASVVVEASMQDVIDQKPERSKLKPKTIFRSIIAWTARYPTIHWWFVSQDRLFCEAFAFRILDRAYREHMNGDNGESADC